MEFETADGVVVLTEAQVQDLELAFKIVELVDYDIAKEMRAEDPFELISILDQAKVLIGGEDL